MQILFIQSQYFFPCRMECRKSTRIEQLGTQKDETQMGRMNNADGYGLAGLANFKIMEKENTFRELNYAICWPKDVFVQHITYPSSCRWRQVKVEIHAQAQHKPKKAKETRVPSTLTSGREEKLEPPL